MRKLLVAVIIILLSNYTYSQSLPTNESGKIVYTDIIKCDSIKKDILFTKCSEWAALSFKDANSAIKMADKNAGKIVIKGFIQTPLEGGFGQWKETGVSFSLNISIKDNKIKYEITDFIHIDLNQKNYPGAGGALENIKPECGSIKMTKSNWTEIKNSVNTNILLIIDNLKKYLLKKDSDW